MPQQEIHGALEVAPLAGALAPVHDLHHQETLVGLPLGERRGRPQPQRREPGGPAVHLDDDRVLHAWAEVYLPGAGWKGFDSTSGLVTGPDHIAVAVSRHSGAVPPVAGAFFSAILQTPVMQVSVQVRKVDGSGF